jgi:hypothetical protein
VGRAIEWEKVREIYQLGLKHGMKLAAISGVNGPFSDEDIERVRELALIARADLAQPVVKLAAKKMAVKKTAVKKTMVNKALVAEPEVSKPPASKKAVKTKKTNAAKLAASEA